MRNIVIKPIQGEAEISKALAAEDGWVIMHRSFPQAAAEAADTSHDAMLAASNE